MIKQLDLSGVRIYKPEKQDIIEAMDLIGEEVYLSDCAGFGSYVKAKLTGVIHAEDDDHPFFHRGENLDQLGYRYLILAKDAKFIERKSKKLRPFKSTWEFERVTGCGIGDVITIRKVDGGFEESCIVNGYRYSVIEHPKSTIVYITLGADKYSLEELFRYFKYRKNDELLPFGVEE